MIPHGGNLAAARARFPGAPDPWIDLSTGINPIPYPVRQIDYTRLPESEDLTRLEHAAAQAYGADPATIVAAPGTQILISLLPHIFPAPSMAVLGPTYAEHAAAWAAAGTQVTEITTLDDRAPNDGIVLCNPNNPDGRRIPATQLTALAEQLNGRRLIVDEAFADLEAPGLSLAPALPPNTIVLRSFGKTYGLAGLRLGFAIAPPELAERIREILGPWPVSTAAITIGTVALLDAAWRTAARTRLTQDAARLDALLSAAGLTPIGGTVLYRLTQSNDATARFETLAQAGILTRPFPANPTWLRFGIPAPSAWPRLTSALAPA